MATDLKYFLTETLYAIPEELPLIASIPKAEAVSNPAQVSEEREKAEIIVEQETIAGFGVNGYQLSKAGGCNTILITSIAPELFDEIPSFGFLPKMLQAVGEDADQVCYLNLAPDKEQVTELQLLKNYRNALIFLNEQHPFAKRLKLNPYEPKRFQEMNTVLANELAVIENDRNLKASLWEALRTMYLTK